MSAIIGLWAVAVAIQAQKEAVHSPVKHTSLTSAVTLTADTATELNTTAIPAVEERAQGGNVLVRLIVGHIKRLVVTAVCFLVVAMVWAFIKETIKVRKARRQKELEKKAQQIQARRAKQAEQAAKEALKWGKQQNVDAILTATDYTKAKLALDAINDEGNELIAKCVEFGELAPNPDGKSKWLHTLLMPSHYKAVQAVLSRMKNAQDAFDELYKTKSWPESNIHKLSGGLSLKSYHPGIHDRKGYYRVASSEEELYWDLVDL